MRQGVFGLGEPGDHPSKRVESKKKDEGEELMGGVARSPSTFLPRGGPPPPVTRLVVVTVAAAVPVVPGATSSTATAVVTTAPAAV